MFECVDCFDMQHADRFWFLWHGGASNNFYCYLNDMIALTWSTLIAVIALACATMINVYCYLNTASAALLGYDFFDMHCAASLYFFGRYDCYATIDFYWYLNVCITLMHATVTGFDFFCMGANANHFYCYLNILIALMHATLIGIDWLDVCYCYASNNFYFYLNTLIALTCTTLIGFIALVGDTTNDTCCCFNEDVATLLGLDIFDI